MSMSFSVVSNLLRRTVQSRAAVKPAHGTGTKCKHVYVLSLWVMAVVFAASVIPKASASAIPMWEFLSRDEKMSHLFNTFTKQAAEYCKSSTMPDCNKVILIYGLTNLAKMDDASLDQMDPYQRGANDKIWETIMKNSNSDGVTSQSQVGQAGQKRDYYADALEPVSTDENYLGSASNNVELSVSGDGDADGESGDSYMTGPMVVRVRTDGSPIPSDQQSAAYLPKDEDKEEHKAMRSKIVPSVSELRALFSPSSAATAAAVDAEAEAEAAAAVEVIVPTSAPAPRGPIEYTFGNRYSTSNILRSSYN